MEQRGLSDEAVSAACKDGNPITKDYMMQQTMLRVKDPARSLDFYTRILGLTLLQKIDFPLMRFSHYFLGYEDKSEIPADVSERTAWTFSRRGTIELMHNWGSELDPGLSYHHGNHRPLGFGHIGIAVPDVSAACDVFEQQGVKMVHSPASGELDHPCASPGPGSVLPPQLIPKENCGKLDQTFIQDPDGYWIEIFSPSDMVSAMAPVQSEVTHRTCSDVKTTELPHQRDQVPQNCPKR